MSIIAHVEPRDIGAVFGNPTYYLGYDNPSSQADSPPPTQGTPAGAGRRTEEGGAAAVRGRRRRLAVPAAQPDRRRRRASPACRRTPSPSRSTCRAWPGPERATAVTPDAAMALRVLQRTLRAAREPGRQLGAGLRLHGACCPATRRGSRSGVNASDRGGGAAAAASSASTGRCATQYFGWVGGLLTGDPGTSYVSQAPIGAADRRPAAGDAHGSSWRAWSSRWSSRCRSAR